MDAIRERRLRVERRESDDRKSAPGSPAPVVLKSPSSLNCSEDLCLVGGDSEDEFDAVRKRGGEAVQEFRSKVAFNEIQANEDQN
ncbi:hypothetical protein F7725_020838 [Dissostichus mawsoni]|uniref:Uncharacterized protein n=1 Tax=Dissostichus mawsoni TaxID=36200 RepID=A0A7J5YEG0_DISMA|nr:hypothetical protein F7725_020838 [Dissostichus mawsoni]